MASKDPASQRRALFKRKGIREIFHEFANETTLHGVKEISKYWTVIPLRLFFIACQLVCWSILIYHMYLVISQFLASPTMIQHVTTTDKTYPYPNLTFCPERWMNTTKVKELGLTKPAVLYALSLMKRVILNEKVDVELGKRQLKEFMIKKNFSSYFDLYTTIANDFTEKSLFCTECKTWPPKKVVMERGVCYYLTFNDCEATILVDRQPKILYNPITYENDTILRAFHSVAVGEYVAVGAHESDYSSLQPIFLASNQTYFFQVTPTKRVSINDKFTRCDENPKDVSPFTCRAYCYQETMGRMCGVPTMLGYFPGSQAVGPKDDTKLWTSLNQSLLDYYAEIKACRSRQDVLRELDKCSEIMCPPLCLETDFSTISQAQPGRHVLHDVNESTITVVIAYQVRTGIVVVLESYSYTWYSFLSDVGGLLGLWCGASVISLAPIATFFILQLTLCLVCRKKGENQVYDSKIEHKG